MRLPLFRGQVVRAHRMVLSIENRGQLMARQFITGLGDEALENEDRGSDAGQS